jgi:gliding motility-associated-like protein
MENIRQTLFVIMQEMNPKHLAFACLVSEIDGEPCDDISDDGLRKTLHILGDVPVKEMTAEGEAVKKKIDEELSLYFPDEFDDAKEKEYYDIMKRRALAMLDAVIHGDTDERKAVIENLTDRLVCFYKPKTFKSIVEFRAIIFNRWGQKLYEWNDVAAEGWDGSYNGRQVKQGTYFVLCNAKGADGKVFKIKKDVNILRGFEKIDDESTPEL